MTKIKPEDHPDFIGGWKWTKLELDWINERIGTLESALFQSQEAAKDLASQLAKKETLLNEAMWSYGELKREQLANQAKTSSSPIEDWEAVAADQAMTIALLKAERQRAAWAGLTDEQITAGARALCKQMAEACDVDVRDQWQLYSDTFKEDAKAVLTAAAKLREKNAQPSKPLTDEQKIAEALRRHGLTLVKTAAGYDVLKLGQISAHAKGDA